jgi:hypothetical protein
MPPVPSGGGGGTSIAEYATSSSSATAVTSAPASVTITYSEDSTPTPTPTAAPPPSSLLIGRQTATVTQGGDLTVRITCSGSPCSGSLTLTEPRGNDRKKGAPSSPLTIGSAEFSSIAVGLHAVSLNLTARGLSLLKTNHYRLQSEVTASIHNHRLRVGNDRRADSAPRH